MMTRTRISVCRVTMRLAWSWLMMVVAKEEKPREVRPRVRCNIRTTELGTIIVRFVELNGHDGRALHLSSLITL
jgi:hypothetical protein